MSNSDESKLHTLALNKNMYSIKTWVSLNTCFVPTQNDSEMNVHFAAWTANVRLVEMWIMKRENVTAQDKYGLDSTTFSCLEYASRCCQNIAGCSHVELGSKESGRLDGFAFGSRE